MTAIYARQSVDKKDSISIDTQIDMCRRYCTDEYRVYSDKGWSGKNLERPDFRRLLGDIKSGRIDKLIVYKLDRISRSLNDFSNLMETFKRYGVEFASTVETFDTSTPIGRAMLGIIMVFAELERENILLRVKDNYYARGEKGLYLGGVPVYGFDKIPTKLNGIKTSVLIPNNDLATVEYIFSAYRESGSSLGRIVKELNGRGVPSPAGALWDSSKLSRLLRSPTYVMADVEVYRYFRERGAKISNPVEDFTGERGCFLYGKREANERKYTDVHDHVLSLGLHDGVISSELWLDVQRKLDGNSQIKKGKSGSYSWLTGLIKCGKCGYAMRVQDGEYFSCTGKANHGACDGVDGKPLIADVEGAVYAELRRKFDEVRDIAVEEKKPSASPRANKLKMRLEALNAQIDNLADKIAETSEAIGAVLERKLESLIRERCEVRAELDKLGTCAKQRLAYAELLPLTDEFPSMSLETKRGIARLFIAKILLWEEKIEIVWKF
ncbi:MAG: recombinase family protein [Lachnospiraceae bacterium]|nr:recombinase family protein [Ruminococcus sp.]MCM1274455.1 recombinase family protein [Lachnospiraceae bacterium]